MDSHFFIYQMLASGPRSYYDEYARKRGSSRIIHDPPSLLTDRGAYVNFLEVQLERVSAACLGVQAYDQRFNDIQQQYINLDEKLSSTTRLLVLAQQCTEEVRHEADQKSTMIAKQGRRDHDEIMELLRLVNDRVTNLEASVASSLKSIDKRIDGMEKHISDQSHHISHEEDATRADILRLKNSIVSLEKKDDDARDILIKLSESSQIFDRRLTEAAHRLDVSMLSLDIKVKDSLESQRLECVNKIEAVSQNWVTMLQEAESEWLTSVNNVKEATRLLQNQHENDIETLNSTINRVSETITSRTEEIESLSAMLTSLEAKHGSSHDMVVVQLASLGEELGSISDAVNIVKEDSNRLDALDEIVWSIHQKLSRPSSKSRRQGSTSRGRHKEEYDDFDDLDDREHEYSSGKRDQEIEEDFETEVDEENDYDRRRAFHSRPQETKTARRATHKRRTHPNESRVAESQSSNVVVSQGTDQIITIHLSIDSLCRKFAYRDSCDFSRSQQRIREALDFFSRGTFSHSRKVYLI